LVIKKEEEKEKKINLYPVALYFTFSSSISYIYKDTWILMRLVHYAVRVNHEAIKTVQSVRLRQVRLTWSTMKFLWIPMHSMPDHGQIVKEKTYISNIRLWDC
jgi:hypothetical protein